MGIGRLLGGALQGYGAGLVQSSVMAEDERRAMALEKLRNENDTAKMERQYQLADVNAAKSDARSDVNDARKTARTVEAEIKVGATKFDQQLTMAQIDQGNRESLARLQSNLNLTEIQKRATIEAANEAKAAGSYVKEWVTNSEGMLVGMTATGKQITTNVKPAPKAEKGEGGILAEARAGRQTAPAPKTTPAPAVVKETLPTIGSDAAAEAFVKNPKNKGRTFIGPDGKRYKV